MAFLPTPRDSICSQARGQAAAQLARKTRRDERELPWRAQGRLVPGRDLCIVLDAGLPQQGPRKGTRPPECMLKDKNTLGSASSSPALFSLAVSHLCQTALGLCGQALADLKRPGEGVGGQPSTSLPRRRALWLGRRASGDRARLGQLLAGARQAGSMSVGRGCFVFAVRFYFRCPFEEAASAGQQALLSGGQLSVLVSRRVMGHGVLLLLLLLRFVTIVTDKKNKKKAHAKEALAFELWWSDVVGRWLPFCRKATRTAHCTRPGNKGGQKQQIERVPVQLLALTGV